MSKASAQGCYVDLFIISVSVHFIFCLYIYLTQAGHPIDWINKIVSACEKKNKMNLCAEMENSFRFSKQRKYFT